MICVCLGAASDTLGGEGGGRRPLLCRPLCGEGRACVALVMREVEGVVAALSCAAGVINIPWASCGEEREKREG